VSTQGIYWEALHLTAGRGDRPQLCDDQEQGQGAPPPLLGGGGLTSQLT
jgi:hypothetical protein